MKLRWIAWVLLYGRSSTWQRLKALFGYQADYQIADTGNGQWIYALHDPFSRRPFYIGRSNNPGRRYVEHVNFADGTDKSLYIQRLKRANAIPFMTILEECGWDNVHERERYWIGRFGGKYQLENMTD